MNYSPIFTATARTERFAKAHALNFSTYLLVAFTIALTLTIAAIDWAIVQLDKAPEYVIRLKLAKIRTQRQVIQLAIKAEQFRVAAAPRITTALDKAFCLN